MRIKVLRGTSDHASFWQHGFSAAFFHEDPQSSPYLHTVADTIGTSYNDPLLATLVTQETVALLATLAGAYEVPVALESFVARWESGGASLAWELAPAAVRELQGVHVARAPAAAGPFARLTRQPLAPARRGAFVDADPCCSTPLWYRLELLSADSWQEFLASPQAVLMLAKSTFVWLDSIDAVNGTNGYPRSLQGHMDAALAQGANAIELVIYDLPNRDCAALASNGEIASGQLSKYQSQYIDPIAAIRVLRGSSVVPPVWRREYRLPIAPQRIDVATQLPPATNPVATDYTVAMWYFAAWEREYTWDGWRQVAEEGAEEEKPKASKPESK